MAHVIIRTVLAVVLLGAFLGAPARPQGGTPLLVPADMETASLPARRAAQLATRPSFGVVHDFGFEDRRAASGIAFRHWIVDDAGLTYKAVHYDHGNGMAVADVDGDGRLDLYFTTQLGGNALYRNLGGGRFEDVTARAGAALAMTDRVSVSASFADVDNDGDPDLFVTTVRKGNALFENDGKGVFSDVTKEAGLGYVGHSSAGGLLRLRPRRPARPLPCQRRRLHHRGARARRLLRRRRSGLRRPPQARAARALDPLPEPRRPEVRGRHRGDRARRRAAGAATPRSVDVNGDGWPDLYVLNMQGDDHFWENVQGQRFVDRTAAALPEDAMGDDGRSSSSTGTTTAGWT